MVINKIIHHFVHIADSTAPCTWHCFRSSASQNCYWHWFPVCSATWCTVGRRERRDSGPVWSICMFLVFPEKHIQPSYSTSSTALGACSHDGRWIYRCVLLHFRGRIEIDHSYSLRWSGLCCHSGTVLLRPAEDEESALQNVSIS